MEIDKGYDEHIERIEDFDADEMLHVFNVIRDSIEALCVHANKEPDYFQEVTEKQVDYNLRTIAHSIKKSLNGFYPDKAEEILTTNNIEYAEGLGAYYRLHYPLCEGAVALTKIYTIIRAYKFYYAPEDKELILARLVDMETAIKDYKMHALDIHQKRRNTEREKQVEYGRESGYKKAAMGIRQAIVDHNRHPDLCEACAGEPIELKAQAFISRFKAKHSCTIRNLYDFDEDIILRKAYLAREPNGYYVFYNLCGDKMCEYREGEGIKEFELATVRNMVTSVKKYIKKHSR